MQQPKIPVICTHSKAQKCLAMPKMIVPSIVFYLEQIQINAKVDLQPLIDYSQLLLTFMSGDIHKHIKKQLIKPLGNENLFYYQTIIENVCHTAVAGLDHKHRTIDLVRDVEEPLFVGITQGVFGYKPTCVESFLKDVDVGVKIAEPVQSVKKLLKIQSVLVGMITEITEQLKAPLKQNLISDIRHALRSGAEPHSLEQIAATIVILIIASRTTSELISHIIIKNSNLNGVTRAYYSDKQWVSDHFESLVRFCASTEYLTRVASCDMAIEDMSLSKNDSVYIHIPSVNRDATFYRNNKYEQIDGSSPERHMAFGAGVHRCPGQFLARQLVVTYIPELYSRFPDITVDPNSVTYKSSVLAKRVASAPVLLSKSPQGNNQK
jgi:cytochrome P450